MPIRFRCVYCNQLLGIARRKAGTVVSCTTCGGQLIVPEPNDPVTTEPAEPNEHVSAPPPPAPAQGGILEQSDFDAILEPPGGAPRPAAVANPPAPPPSSGRGRRAAAAASFLHPSPAKPGAAPALVL